MGQEDVSEVPLNCGLMRSVSGGVCKTWRIIPRGRVLRTMTILATSSRRPPARRGPSGKVLVKASRFA